MAYINREHFLQELAELFETFPVVSILGARQCGKSTLAQQYIKHFSGKVTTFDLENEVDQARLTEAQLTLQPLQGLVVIDEIQRRPNLFPVIRYLVDTSSQKYLILGSSSRDLIQQSSESLAGRIAYIELPPFLLFEIENEAINNLWCRGGFPRSFLARSDKASYRWRQEYIKTFLERDLAISGFDVEPATLRRFWQMLAHYHGQTFNASEIAASLGFTAKTSKRYIDILEGTFMVRQLKPWFENIRKRQVKASKMYIKDSGLLHALLGIIDFSQLQAHPKVGASWESFSIENIVNRLEVDSDDCYFWGTHNHAELDLMVIKDGKKLGFEFKYTASPKVTKSMRIALDDLNLSEMTVIVPNGPSYHLGDKIRVCGLGDYKVR